jgi:hypothetical protein
MRQFDYEFESMNDATVMLNAAEKYCIAKGELRFCASRGSFYTLFLL